MSQTLYQPLLDRSPVLPADLLRAAYQYASQTGDVPMLVALAGRFDISADVHQSLAAVQVPAVVAAFRGRATLPGAAGQRQPETRAAVLAKAVGRYGTPDAAAFADAVAVYMDKPTATLLRVLGNRPANWYTPEQAAALLLGHQSWPERTDYEQYRNLCARLGPQAAATLAPQLTLESIVAELARFPIDTATATALACAAVDAARHPGINRTLDTIFGYRTPEERAVVGEAAAAYAAKHAAGLVQLVRQYARASYTPKQRLPWNLSAPACPRVTASLEDASIGVLLAAAAVADLTLLGQVVDRLCRDKALRGDELVSVCTVLLRNPALDVTDLHRLMGHLGTFRPGHFPLRDLSKVDAIGLWPGDEVVARTWCHLFPVAVLRSRGWEPFGGTGAIGDVLVRWDAQHGAGVWDWQVQDALNAAVATGVSDTDLARVRHGLLMAAVARISNDHPSLIGEQVARILTGALGADTRRWALYEQLAEQFTGSLGQLLDTVESLTA